MSSSIGGMGFRRRRLLGRVAEVLRTRSTPSRADPRSTEHAGSGLDRLIPPEIADDPFARTIEEIAATPGVREILEIGSSAGEGSTAAWVRGALRNPRRPRLHCIEVSTERYSELARRWGDQDFVLCHHLSSIPLERLASATEVERFYRDVPSRLREFDLTTVLGWLEQDVGYLRDNGLSSPGIAQIKEQYGIELFDAVLIDGSEFAGRAELEEVYGARFLLLDDTETFKNWHASRSLEADPNYAVVRADRDVRNGFAIFERIA